MFRERQRDSAAPPRSLSRCPSTSIAPDVGRSSPPIRLSRVVVPDPEGPMRARNSPRGMSTLTPCSTSMRSLPRVKYLWTSRIRTRGGESAIVMFPCRPNLKVRPSTGLPALKDLLHLHSYLRAILQFWRRRDDDAIARAEPAEDLDAIAVRSG